MRLRNSRICLRLNFVMSCPSKKIWPEVGSMSRSTTRPVVDLPQPLSPTNPSVSPRLMLKLTPSTAFTEPIWREKMMPRVTGKCLTKSRTSSSGRSPLPAFCRAGSLAIAMSAHLLPHRPVVRMNEARRLVPAAQVDELRLLLAADVAGELAARVEAAALRHVEGARHHTLDGLQPLLLLVQLGQRVEQALGIRVLRAAEQGPHVGLLDNLPGVHDDDFLDHLGDDAQVVRYQDDGGA